uniref:LRAT domain-containing protein n=1 Tax=Strigamia maritima TaxID=126957 RepID=T1IPG1_STRMM
MNILTIRSFLTGGEKFGDETKHSTYMMRKKVSRCYRRHELHLLYRQLQLGDLLEFKRRGFSHWAVYVGIAEYEGIEQHCVIHRSLPAESDVHSLLSLVCLSSSPSKRKKKGDDFGSIQIDSIEVAFGILDENDVVVINNQLDEKWRPFPVEEIVERAKFLMYMAEPYNFATNNCEHFANRCRYGRNFSRQITKGVLKIASTIASAAATLAARNAWKATMPVLMSAAAAAGVSVGPVGVAAIGAAPTVAGVLVSAAPTILHAIQSHRDRKLN